MTNSPILLTALASVTGTVAIFFLYRYFNRVNLWYAKSYGTSFSNFELSDTFNSEETIEVNSLSVSECVIHNLGHTSATQIRVVLPRKLKQLIVKPDINYELSDGSNGNHVCTFESIAPKEHVKINVLHDGHYSDITISCKECKVKEFLYPFPVPKPSILDRVGNHIVWIIPLIFTLLSIIFFANKE